MKINTSFHSSCFDVRREGTALEFLIFHYTACDLDLALKLLTGGDPSHQVSAHYLISEAGDVYQLVDESKRAWHAGSSSWEGKEDINSRSIGIELVHPGHTPDMRPFSEKQIEALMGLSKTMIDCYRINPSHVLGHSDIAPLRKADPGELFPWKQLAAEGIGLYPNVPSLSSLGGTQTDLSSALSAYGYQAPKNETEAALIVKAFQRHFCPPSLGRGITPETCFSLRSLLKKKKRFKDHRP